MAKRFQRIRVPGAAVFGRYGKAPIHWHWTALVGAALFSGLTLAPGRWAAFPLVILVHELGHAVLVRRYRLRVLALVIHGAGGECLHEPGRPLQHSVIAWGGVQGQFALWLAAGAATVFHLVPRAGFAADLTYALLVPNAILAAYNLLPLRNFDGVEAWKVWRRLRQRARLPARRRAEAMASRLNELDRRAMPEQIQFDVAALIASVRKPTDPS